MATATTKNGMPLTFNYSHPRDILSRRVYGSPRKAQASTKTTAQAIDNITKCKLCGLRHPEPVCLQWMWQVRYALARPMTWKLQNSLWWRWVTFICSHDHWFAPVNQLTQSLVRTQGLKVSLFLVSFSIYRLVLTPFHLFFLGNRLFYFINWRIHW